MRQRLEHPCPGLLVGSQLEAMPAARGVQARPAVPALLCVCVQGCDGTCVVRRSRLRPGCCSRGQQLLPHAGPKQARQRSSAQLGCTHAVPAGLIHLCQRVIAQGSSCVRDGVHGRQVFTRPGCQRCQLGDAAGVTPAQAVCTSACRTDDNRPAVTAAFLRTRLP